MNRSIRVTLVGSVLVGVTFAMAGSASTLEDAKTTELRQGCKTAIETVRSEIDSRHTMQTILVVAGAIAAAAGSITAGISSKESVRKIGAGIGALSGICTAGIQTLPDGQRAQNRLIAMDRQQIVAEKVFAQLDLIRDESSRLEYIKFVRARYTECTAQEPPTPPDLPKARTVSVAAVSGKAGDDSAQSPEVTESVAAMTAAPEYWVQVATGDLDGLKRHAAYLKGQSKPAKVYSAKCSGQPCFALVLGPFGTREQAENLKGPNELVTQGRTLEREQD